MYELMCLICAYVPKTDETNEAKISSVRRFLAVIIDRAEILRQKRRGFKSPR
jgi:hypothetical protein